MSVTETADSAAVAAEEAGLVARTASGDVGAPVAELYRRYGRRLYRFGVKHLGNEGLAEEMVQETFVRLWRTAGRFDADKAVSVPTCTSWPAAPPPTSTSAPRPGRSFPIPLLTSRPWPTAWTRFWTP